MVARATHKWAFKPGMRAGAYSWKSSSKAIERLKSASSEIRAVARVAPITAAEGVRVLHTRLSHRGFAPVPTLTAERQSSSLPIHAYDTFGVSLGLTRAF